MKFLNELKTEFIYGINLIDSNDVFFFDIPMECTLLNNGQFLTEVKIKELLGNENKLICIKDFNCKKSDADILFKLLLTAQKQIVMTTENLSLIDSLLKTAKNIKQNNVIAIDNNKILSFDLLYRLRYNRGLAIF